QRRRCQKFHIAPAHDAEGEKHRRAEEDADAGAEMREPVNAMAEEQRRRKKGCGQRAGQPIRNAQAVKIADGGQRQAENIESECRLTANRRRHGARDHIHRAPPLPCCLSSSLPELLADSLKDPLPPAAAGVNHGKKKAALVARPKFREETPKRRPRRYMADSTQNANGTGRMAALRRTQPDAAM